MKYPTSALSLACLLVVACAADDAAPDPGAADAGPLFDASPTPDAAAEQHLPGDGELELVGTGVCELSFDRLRRCRPPRTRVVPASAPEDRQRRFTTRIQRHVDGACSSGFARFVRISAAGAEDVVYRFTRDEAVEVRAAAGAAIAELTLVEEGEWIAKATYDPTCRVWLTFDVNRADGQ